MTRLHADKLMLSLLLGATIGSMCSWILRPLSVAAQAAISGDIDGDRQVTAADLGLLASYLQGQRSFMNREIEAADVNRDGIIDGTDYQQLQQTLQADSSASGSDVQFDSAQSGQVVDRATGEPLANVDVEIPDAGVSVRTDSEGRFQLPDDVPANEILTARVEDYAPYSKTTQPGGAPLRVELERFNAETTIVLQSEVVHLGDNAYSNQSAAADRFQLESQGRELVRTFQLDRIPYRSPQLTIGSLIGLDTAAAYRAGQTQIPEADMSPLEIVLNGTRIRTVEIGADNIVIPLPLDFLRSGLNTVEIRTGRTTRVASSRGPGVNFPVFGGDISIGFPARRSVARPVVDYDDIELANVTIELPPS